MILSFSIAIVSSLDPASDFSLAFSATDSVPQDTGPLLADELSATQPTSLLDLTGPSEDSETFLSDAPGLTSLSLSPYELSHDPVDLFQDQSPPLPDVSTLSGGSESHLDDAFDSLLESDVNSKTDEPDIGSLSDPTLSDTSFELADCAMSDALLGTGKKSRFKRLDDPGSCKNPTTAPLKSAETLPSGGDEIVKLPDVMTILDNPYLLLKFAAARKNEDHNTYCFLFSEGIVPWGVCSSGNRDDQRKLSDQLHIITIGFFDAYELSHCTLSTSSHPNTHSSTSLYEYIKAVYRR